MNFHRHGITVEVPPGWEAETFFTASSGPDPSGGEAEAIPTAASLSVLHLGNFPLPPERSAFGFEAIMGMTRTDLFISLVEFGETAAASALFSKSGLPEVRTSDFSTQAVVPPTAAAAGAQYFFHEGRRGFCLYLVVGGSSLRSVLVPTLRPVVESIRVS